MILWPFLFVALVFAQDQMVEKYCFSSTTGMSGALSQLRSISVPSDRITPEGNCFTVAMSDHRRELIQKYLLSIAPDMSITFSSAELKRAHCELKVEKVKAVTGQKKRLGLNGAPIARVVNKHGQSSEIFHIKTLKEFELSIDQDTIEGECRYLSPDKYEITLKVRKHPRPLHPPVAPGTIVVLQTPPPDQETMLLQTQLQLVRGNKIEIGSVVKELKDKDRNLDASPKIKVDAQTKKSTEKIFLSVN